MADIQKIDLLDKKITELLVQRKHLIQKMNPYRDIVESNIIIRKNAIFNWDTERTRNDEDRLRLEWIRKEISRLKLQKEDLHHCYSFILVGDYLATNGHVIQNCIHNDEFLSTIDCDGNNKENLKDKKTNENALLAILKQEYSPLFKDGKFEVKYIIQIK